MKKLFIICIAAIALGLSSFRIASELNKADVDSKQGLMIFHLSKPSAKYDYLGTYKIQFISSGKPEILLNKLIDKTKEKYPKANAIIVSSDMGQCDAITIKE